MVVFGRESTLKSFCGRLKSARRDEQNFKTSRTAGAIPGSVTYHFKTKDGLLLEIYRRHCGPMNRRRSELLAAARRVRDLQDRLEAIVRAYVLPAFTSGSDLAGGGTRFTRLRAIMSAAALLAS